MVLLSVSDISAIEIMFDLLSMVVLFGLQAMGVELWVYYGLLLLSYWLSMSFVWLNWEIEMRNVLHCIKEMTIMFALLGMVMAAAVGGACLLLHTL